MDFLKHKAAFNEMSYDSKSPLKVSLPNSRSTIIVTESSDLESCTDFIARSFQGDDLNQIRTILVQASVESRFVNLLKPKLKELNSSQKLTELKTQFEKFRSMGLTLIEGPVGSSGVGCTIVQAPRSLIPSEDLPIVNLEVFRTTKEGISFASCSLSVGLWCENISIAFEYINALKNARQIWLNSHGATHPKIPFYNGKIFCEDSKNLSKTTSDFAEPIIHVEGNTQFQTTFRANTFQTIVIPFGESFAN